MIANGPEGEREQGEGRLRLLANLKGFVRQIQTEFGFSPALDPEWGVQIEDDIHSFTSYSFHCPAEHLDAIYGSARFPLALTALDETATSDFYELTVARHRTNATIVTSNRTPDEWLGLMHDQLLAQSAVDRLTSTCHELVIEGDSYRKRQRPSRHSALRTSPHTPR